jgi:predicted nucleic acid-binding protein
MGMTHASDRFTVLPDDQTLAATVAGSEFDPVLFDAEVARIFGRLTAAVIASGRKPQRRIADLMIASTAIADGLPLYTTNPDDFAAMDALIRPHHPGPLAVRPA